MSQNGVSFELQDLTEIVKKSVVVGIRADFRCEFLSVSCGTDRAGAKRGDVVQIFNLGVEFSLGHLLVYRWGMGIPGDFYEVGHNSGLL